MNGSHAVYQGHPSARAALTLHVRTWPHHLSVAWWTLHSAKTSCWLKMVTRGSTRTRSMVAVIFLLLLVHYLDQSCVVEQAVFFFEFLASATLHNNSFIVHLLCLVYTFISSLVFTEGECKGCIQNVQCWNKSDPYMLFLADGQRISLFHSCLTVFVAFCQSVWFVQYV